jgi:hypothetical protein
MSEQEILEPVQPAIELIQGPTGPIWQVSGAGFSSSHQQLWQALLRFDCALIGKGLLPCQFYSGLAKLP